MSFIQNFFTSRDNNANSATYVGQQDRLWWDPVTNRIYFSDGVTPGGFPVGSGGNADLGNWAFIGNTQYNINGGQIDNSDLLHGPTAWFQLPENGGNNSVSVLNYYGNVTLTAGNTPSNTSQWQFDNTGNITLPTNTSSINYANGTPYGAGGAGGSNVTIQNQGNTLTTAANTINFTGNGVSSTNVGNVVTVNITAGSGTQLPSQTGNAEKFLQTTGTDLVWKYVAGIFGLTVDGGTAYNTSNCLVINGGGA